MRITLKRLVGFVFCFIASFGLAGCASFGPGSFEFENTNWHGRWTSHRYPGIEGWVYFDFPEPLPEGEDFEVHGSIIYKQNAFLPMVPLALSFKVRVDSVAPWSDASYPVKEPVSFMMKGGLYESDGIAVFAGTLSEDRTQVTGLYSFDRPYDIGDFQLQLGPPPQAEVAQFIQRSSEAE